MGAIAVPMRKYRILKMIYWDLHLAVIKDAIVSEVLVLNVKLHFSLKNTNCTNNSNTWWEIDTIDALNSLYLISLLYIIACLPFYSFLFIFVMLGIESNVLGMLDKYMLTSLHSQPYVHF